MKHDLSLRSIGEYKPQCNDVKCNPFQQSEFKDSTAFVANEHMRKALNQGLENSRGI